MINFGLGGGALQYEIYIGVKAETSEPRGIWWERRKKSGGIGWEQAKLAKIIKIFPNFATLA